MTGISRREKIRTRRAEGGLMENTVFCRTNRPQKKPHLLTYPEIREIAQARAVQILQSQGIDECPAHMGRVVKASAVKMVNKH